MYANVSNFINHFQGGGARPNRFDVMITFPNVTDYAIGATKLNFTCNATSIPSSIVSPIPVYYMGRAVKIAGDREFEDWNINILNDEDFRVRKVFERWLDHMNGHESNVASDGWGRPSTRNSYFATGLVRQFSKTDDTTPIHTYKMANVFPIQMGAIQVDWGQNNAVEMFSVTLACNFWANEETTT